MTIARKIWYLYAKEWSWKIPVQTHLSAEMFYKDHADLY
jgi:hypothetical protein